ncbi:helix-turn-helix transcriptional regulator [Saccharopolyspora indica]|uniref:helix-turn-helix domain-containing protein n=1 Tax=Saccharopolyspora indica TaxID=1229659 RepID=UPI0022EAE21D|nr:helix-turn-helix transcriptional regulator [Saccharopolyspora indica]MDA3647768.1 helix-turn-helix transcriptional regulator [Saccharopolyspora indica]
MAPVSPTVAAWDVGLRIREKRGALGLSAATAAKQLGIAAAYLSDVEHGKKNLAADRLEKLIGIYEFDAEEADELRFLREQATHRGWWTKYSALFSEDLLRFFGFEHGAESLRIYGNDLLHGLLQTEDYARAIIESGAPNLRLAEVDRRVQCRLARQKRLAGDEPLQIMAVMSEAAVRQQIGGKEVHLAQLKHLADLIEQNPDHLDVRIVPFEATGHPAMGGSGFHLMTFPSGRLPTLLWQETVTSTQLTMDPLTTREYGLAHAEATTSALSREDSFALIKQGFSLS